MAGRSVGIRELKAHLSRYLKQVRQGRSVLVTDHGRPIGRIVPAAESLESRLKSMSQAGVIAWSGKKLAATAPVARIRGKRTIADLLVEDRE